MRDTILLADESTNQRETLCEILGTTYNILEANTVEQAKYLLDHNAGRLVSVIVSMKLLEEAARQAVTEKYELPDHIALIVITSADHHEEDLQAYERDADAVIHWPYHPILVKKIVDKAVSLCESCLNLERIVDEQKESLLHSNDIVVDTLSAIIECRSVESGQHVLRLRNFTRVLLTEIAAVCPEYNLDDSTIASIAGAAALHDIGKIAIPDAILNKPGRLTPEEFEIMKTHAAAGSEILEQLGGIGNEEYLRYAYNICRYHHERWDGSGYPDGLAGEAIPICAQVVGLADAFDALTAKRVYKDAYSCQSAANMILNGECGAFSPKLLECFKHVQGEFFRLAEYYTDNEVSRSDRIREPLAPPGRTAANALQTVLSKYEILLQYLNATVIEFDLDNNMYHYVYNPNPALDYLRNVANLDQAMAMMAQHSVHPEDRALVTDQFHEYLEMFFDSGLRRSVRRYRLLDTDGVYRYYNVTCFRMDSSDNSRRVMAVWDASPENNESFKRVSGSDPFSSSLLLDVRQYTRYDRWLTFGEITEDFCRLLGYTAEEIRTEFHNRLIECVLPESRSMLISQLSAQITGSRNFVVEFPLMKKDGGLVWVLAKGILITGDDGLEYICGSMTDVSVLKNSAATLSSAWSKEDHIQYLIQSRDIIFTWDANKDEFTCSPNWNDKFGYENVSEHFSFNILFRSHLHPNDIGAVKENTDLLRGGKDFTEFAIRIANADGKYLNCLVRLCAKRDECGNLVKIIGRIVDMEKNLGFVSGRQSKGAERDSLTKLLNKEASRSRIEAHMNLMAADNEKESIAALMIIDLDDFKSVNDRYGHLYGDSVLTRISLEISRLFRSTDVVARIGGDEFLVYMPDIPQRELAAKRSGQIIDRINEIFSGQLDGCHFSCSMGIAFAPDHGSAYQELFQHADRALYQAKNEGKSRYAIYDPQTALMNFPMPKTRTVVDSDVQPGWTAANLPRYVFEALYESGDIMATVNHLLAIVGEQINVSRVYIFENNADNTACSNTFEWCNEGIEAQIDNLQDISYETDIPGYEQNFNERGIFYCDDVSKQPDHIRAIVEPQGIKSMLHCAIREKGVFRGYVGFDDNAAPRLWTQDQIDLLTFLAQIISIFVLKERSRKESDIILHDLRDVLNSQFSWVYVIDSKNYALHFLNESTKKLVPNAVYGTPCYKALMNREAPCENCPITNRNHTATIYNDYLNLHVSASANRIIWKDKRDWLVTCRELEDE